MRNQFTGGAEEPANVTSELSDTPDNHSVAASPKEIRKSLIDSQWPNIPNRPQNAAELAFVERNRKRIQALTPVAIQFDNANGDIELDWWHRKPTAGDPGVLLYALPNEQFLGYGGELTPRALRYVDTGEIVYIVRVHYIEKDVATLDALLEKYGPQVRPVVLSNGFITTQWDWMNTGRLVEMIENTKVADISNHDYGNMEAVDAINDFGNTPERDPNPATAEETIEVLEIYRNLNPAGKQFIKELLAEIRAADAEGIEFDETAWNTSAKDRYRKIHNQLKGDKSNDRK